MHIYFMTTNNGKFKSLKRELQNYDTVLLQKPYDIPEPRGDIDKISVYKTAHAYVILNAPVVTTDAGFHIKTLNGWPDSFPKYELQKLRIDGIVKLMDGKKDRRAVFAECLSYMDEENSEPVCFTDYTNGIISDEPRGTTTGKHYLKSDWSMLFIPYGTEKTLAEMSHAEYIQWRKDSGREKSSCYRIFTEWLLKNGKIRLL